MSVLPASTSPLSSLESENDSPCSNEEFDEDDVCGPQQRKKREPRRQPGEKLDLALDLLGRLNWSLRDLLEQLRVSTSADIRRSNKERRRKRYGHAWSSFKSFAYCEMPVGKQARHVLKEEERKGLQPWCREISSEILRKEVLSLAQHSSFGSFQATTSDPAPEVQRILVDSPRAIVELAPEWLRLIDVVSYSTVAQQPRETSPERAAEMAREMFLTFSILCRRMQPRLSDGLPSLFGIYLYEGGAKTRVIDTMSRLGVCLTSRSILNRIHSLEGAAKQEVRKLGSDLTSVVTWDNFEFREGRRGEREGDTAEFRSITTALITQNRYPSVRTLHAGMWQPTKYLLSAKSILNSVQGDSLPLDMSLFFIERSIQDLVTRKYDIWAVAPPSIDRLSKHKTYALPLKPILKDESSTENNLYIIEDIFKEQIGIDPSDPTFSGKLRVVSGDLKTWSRVQSARAYRRHTAHDYFDKMEWTVPILGLWHLRYNMLQLIHRIHWGGPQTDPSTLQYAADRWQRTNVLDGKNFNAVEELVMQSYRSRIIGLMLVLMKKQQVDCATIEQVESWLSLQSKTSWRSFVTSVGRALRISAVDGSEEGVDEIYQNHLKFCRHVEVYLLLRYAIKMADIGLLRLALRYTTIVFLSPDAHTPKYAAGLLYTLHLVDSSAASKEFQDYILANSLVNMSGREDSNFEHDRLLELHNNALKTYLRERTIFSSHNDELLQRWALIGPVLKEFKQAIQSHMGYSSNGKHPDKSSKEDVWSMASNLSHSSLSLQRRDRFSKYPAIDLLHLGFKRLGDAVSKYNDSLSDLAPVTDTLGSGPDVEEQGPDDEDSLDAAGRPLSPAFDAALFDTNADWLAKECA